MDVLETLSIYSILVDDIFKISKGYYVGPTNWRVYKKCKLAVEITGDFGNLFSFAFFPTYMTKK